MVGIEERFLNLVSWLNLMVEMLAVALIAIGVALTVLQAVRTRLKTRRVVYQRTRLTLSHFLVLALEFLLAADLLLTVASPTWADIAMLAAIAVIRTFLNYFLQREVTEIEKVEKAEQAP